MHRPDETWHRLQQWTYGQAPSERLAAQILLADGFTNLDPSHPLGGRDGGKDAVMLLDGKRWIMAAHFPRCQQGFAKIKEKFGHDHAGVAANEAVGMAFVTNQELTEGERFMLKAAVAGPVEIYHLERVATILDQPSMRQVREQFLYIDGMHLSPEEIDALEDELRVRQQDEFGFLSTRGIPPDLRAGEPRLPIAELFVPLRVELPASGVIAGVVERLPPRERAVLNQRLGLHGVSRQTFVDIGRSFNVSPERIRQIEAASVKKIAHDLGNARGIAGLGLQLDHRATAELLRGRHQGLPVLDLLDARRLVVLGGPGSGKSTLTWYLTWAMSGRRAEVPPALPVRVAAAGFARALMNEPVELEGRLFALYPRHEAAIRRALADGTAFVIVDGLDEVTDPQLQARLQDVVNQFLADPAYAETSVLITSRIVGFHPTGPMGELPRVTLAPLSRDEIERFLLAWFGRLDNMDAEAMTTGLLARLDADARMLELAGTPLLLTVLALLLARHEDLPSERAQLYAAATETLLHSWPGQRGRELSFDTVPRWLAPLAREALLVPRAAGVPEEEVMDVLVASWQKLFGDPPTASRERTRQLLHEVRDDSGLLSVTGHTPEGMRVWDFLHRSFAEYLVARDLAERHLRDGDDPLGLAHDEAWREVVLMLFGELGRVRPAAVGPLLRRLATMGSTRWEGTLRRDLRLAVSVLARDVPCEDAGALVKEALAVWSRTMIAPLRQDLATLLRALLDTRHTSLLARCAADVPLSAEQTVEVGRWLRGAERQTLLTPLLDTAVQAVADEAAFALPAIERLRARLSELDGSVALRAAVAISQHDAPAAIPALVRLARDADEDVAERALRALAGLQAPEVGAAAEQLLDLADRYEFRPLLDRLASGGKVTEERMIAAATKPGPRREGALAVLRARASPAVRAFGRRLAASDDIIARLEGMKLSGDEASRTALLRGALREPSSPAHVHAALELLRDEQDADLALAALTEVAHDAAHPKVLTACDELVELEPDSAVAALAEVLRTASEAADRQEAAYLLSLVSEHGGASVLASVLRDPDKVVSLTAVRALVTTVDARGLAPMIDLVLSEGIHVDVLLTVAARGPQSDVLETALTLLRTDDVRRRRLGARLLAISSDAAAPRHAMPLIDDKDATVRCAAAWTLAFSPAMPGGAELAARLGAMLDDQQPIEDPPLGRIDASLQPGEAKPVWCCADIAYRLTEEQPAVLEVSRR